MKRILLVLSLLISGLCLASTGKFAADPNNSYADEIHYDKSIHMIVIHVHAKALWFHIDEFYGLKIKDDKNINKVMVDTLGNTPEVIHLKKL